MIESTKSVAKYPWRFFRIGDLEQVAIENGSDLIAISQLDLKLWIALACPKSTIYFDSKTLDYIDHDTDGRIRVSELISAITWATSIVKNPDIFLGSHADFPLTALHETHPEAQQIYQQCRTILSLLGKENASSISVLDTDAVTAKIYATAFNGDGIITIDSIDNARAKTLFQDICGCMDTHLDRSGKPGLSEDTLNAFYQQIEEYIAWDSQSKEDSIYPFGIQTNQVYELFASLQPKIDDFFSRCKIIAFDSKAHEAFSPSIAEYHNLASRGTTITEHELSIFPLSHISSSVQLPLKDKCNPAWEKMLNTFSELIVIPLIGDSDALSEQDWIAICERVKPLCQWMNNKPRVGIEKLGLPRIKEIYGDIQSKNFLFDCIKKDIQQQSVLDSVITVDKLVRYSQHLYTLIINFINFKAFYSQKQLAVFQAGTLFIDRRCCTFCIKITDSAKHAALGAMAGMFLLYCDCLRDNGKEKMQIVAAVTSGDSDNLLVGRNGIFYDATKKEWDATITKIIDNPISLHQAFWAPYKGFMRLIESNIAKRASESEKKAQSQIEATASTTTSMDKPSHAEAKKVDVGTVAALGVAFGAIGTFIATGMGYMTALYKLGPLTLIGAVCGIFILISTPSMVLAYMKLRKRNIAPLLDANGWAINAPAKITMPLAYQLTWKAKIPLHAKRNIRDPLAEKKSIWPKLLIAVLVMYLIYQISERAGYTPMIKYWIYYWFQKITAPLFFLTLIYFDKLVF